MSLFVVSVNPGTPQLRAASHVDASPLRRSTRTSHNPEVRLETDSNPNVRIAIRWYATGIDPVLLAVFLKDGFQVPEQALARGQGRVNRLTRFRQQLVPVELQRPPVGGDTLGQAEFGINGVDGGDRHNIVDGQGNPRIKPVRRLHPFVPGNGCNLCLPQDAVEGLRDALLGAGRSEEHTAEIQ